MNRKAKMNPWINRLNFALFNNSFTKATFDSAIIKGTPLGFKLLDYNTKKQKTIKNNYETPWYVNFLLRATHFLLTAKCIKNSTL